MSPLMKTLVAFGAVLCSVALVGALIATLLRFRGRPAAPAPTSPAVPPPVLPTSGASGTPPTVVDLPDEASIFVRRQIALDRLKKAHPSRKKFTEAEIKSELKSCSYEDVIRLMQSFRPDLPTFRLLGGRGRFWRNVYFAVLWGIPVAAVAILLHIVLDVVVAWPVWFVTVPSFLVAWVLLMWGALAKRRSGGFLPTGFLSVIQLGESFGWAAYHGHRWWESWIAWVSPFERRQRFSLAEWMHRSPLEEEQDKDYLFSTASFVYPPDAPEPKETTEEKKGEGKEKAEGKKEGEEKKDEGDKGKKAEEGKKEKPKPKPEFDATRSIKILTTEEVEGVQVKVTVMVTIQLIARIPAEAIIIFGDATEDPLGVLLKFALGRIQEEYNEESLTDVLTGRLESVLGYEFVLEALSRGVLIERVVVRREIVEGDDEIEKDLAGPYRERLKSKTAEIEARGLQAKAAATPRGEVGGLISGLAASLEAAGVDQDTIAQVTAVAGTQFLPSKVGEKAEITAFMMGGGEGAGIVPQLMSAALATGLAIKAKGTKSGAPAAGASTGGGTPTSAPTPGGSTSKPPSGSPAPPKGGTGGGGPSRRRRRT